MSDGELYGVKGGGMLVDYEAVTDFVVCICACILFGAGIVAIVAVVARFVCWLWGGC